MYTTQNIFVKTNTKRKVPQATKVMISMVNEMSAPQEYSTGKVSHEGVQPSEIPVTREEGKKHLGFPWMLKVIGAGVGMHPHGDIISCPCSQQF